MKFLAFIGFVVLIPLTTALRGYELAVLWRWFIVPQFHLPLLSIPAALGLACVAAALAHQVDYGEDAKSKSELRYRVFVAISMPLLGLGFGWLVKLFL